MVETYCFIWLTTTSARRITTTYKTSFHTLQPTLEAIGKLLKPSAKPGRRSWCFALDLRGAMEMIQGPSLAMWWLDGILKSDGSYEIMMNLSYFWMFFLCSMTKFWLSFGFIQYHDMKPGHSGFSKEFRHSCTKEFQFELQRKETS